MARGASQSQTTSSSSSSRAGVTAPRGSAAATAGMRRRRVVSSGSSSGGGGGSVTGGSSGNILRFYTDDAPGLKISPTIVLVISLCFIGFVTALHVFGKLYRSKLPAKRIGEVVSGNLLSDPARVLTESGNLKLKEISVVCEIARTRVFLCRLRSLRHQKLGLEMQYRLAQTWLYHRLSRENNWVLTWVAFIGRTKDRSGQLLRGFG
ncbi:PROTEIN TRANSPORT PROTEIN SEC61 SUBUNIT BETA [Salix viminalis]|uniref:PROTEIN TRANSPORT PROTEIN SEC61 SUBUNIT BETA n=1 Tax=Salix viminalis TaxID=40686 RepID=A0A9Q0NIV7_SALVM|nr:PROTEIN TRANSPORT PROTEIN SEC61 SUBUNIT BETA [Salix viminalis]